MFDKGMLYFLALICLLNSQAVNWGGYESIPADSQLVMQQADSM